MTNVIRIYLFQFIYEQLNILTKIQKKYLIVHYMYIQYLMST